MDYADTDKYKSMMKKDYLNKIQKSNSIELPTISFDTSTQLGIQALANVIIYKNIDNMNCVAEYF